MGQPGPTAAYSCPSEVTKIWGATASKDWLLAVTSSQKGLNEITTVFLSKNFVIFRRSYHNYQGADSRQTWDLFQRANKSPWRAPRGSYQTFLAVKATRSIHHREQWRTVTFPFIWTHLVITQKFLYLWMTQGTCPGNQTARSTHHRESISLITRIRSCLTETHLMKDGIGTSPFMQSLASILTLQSHQSDDRNQRISFDEACEQK